jgi:SAM-dependent methyltransferase
MLKIDPAKDWSRLGDEDAYFGVLSSPEYRGRQLDDAALRAFYESGREHVRRVLSIVRHHFGFDPARSRALDFGCGVGRLTCAMATHFGEVVGVDVSQGMLDKAAAHARTQGVSNISYVNPLRGYEIPTEQFDLVHSYIVLQHLRVEDGERAMRGMIRGLRAGGVGALHFTYSHQKGRLLHGAREMCKRNALTRALGNVWMGRGWNAPTMLMSPYSIERVLGILAEAGIEKTLVHRVDDWGTHGLFVFFRKGEGARSEWSNPVR